MKSSSFRCHIKTYQKQALMKNFSNVPFFTDRVKVNFAKTFNNRDTIHGINVKNN